MLVRELAGHDPTRFPHVLKWPFSEALAALEAIKIADARREYELQVQIWATLLFSGGPKKPPELPDILKEL